MLWMIEMKIILCVTYLYCYTVLWICRPNKFEWRWEVGVLVFFFKGGVVTRACHY